VPVCLIVAESGLENARLGAHIPGMDQILPPELNDFEFEALRQLAAHPASRHIPSRIQARLKDIGYAKEVLGGLVLTQDGLQRVGMGR
jgi:hypothetical protein